MIYYAYKNRHSIACDGFYSLHQSEQRAVKAFIKKLAVRGEKFRPINKIQWPLRGYTYGEYKPRPHRFFFFRIVGNNLIFFDYAYKVQDTLGDTVYRRIENRKEEYEREFLRQYKNIS